jgi:hypothetical protein
MFQYNKPCKTITGEIVTPYTKEGNKILCFNSKGETVYKEVKDFKVIENREQKVITAIPKEKPKEIKKEEIIETPIVEEKVIEKKPRKKRVKKEKPIEKKKVIVSSKEEQRIVKQDTFKEEIIENYKGNTIEEEYI